MNEIPSIYEDVPVEVELVEARRFGDEDSVGLIEIAVLFFRVKIEGRISERCPCG